MHIIIKGAKTIAEYKAIKESMEKLILKCLDSHKKALCTWREGEAVKAWLDCDGNICIEYKSGKWWRYNEKGECIQ